MTPFPRACDGTCDTPERRRNGCACSWGHPWGEHGGEGYKALRGPFVREGRLPGSKLRSQATDMEWRCPQYYLQSPLVSDVLSQVDDYENNRMGTIYDLPAALVVYLRTASAELKEFKSFWESELMPDPKRKPGHV